MNQRIQRPTTDQAASQKQAIRYNENCGCFEVYTFLSGSIGEKWKWYQVTEDIAKWYIEVRKTPVEATIPKKKEGEPS